MKKYIFLLISFALAGIIFMTSTKSFAEIQTTNSFAQNGPAQAPPNNEHRGEQDTEPQPEPGPSRGRVLPVRR